MGRTVQIGVIGEMIGQVAGPEVQAQVMEGSEKIKDSTKAEKVAAWVQGAMARLDALVEPETGAQIMTNCGYNCAMINKGAIKKNVARRKKYETLDAYLEAEHSDPMPGTRLERDGDMVYQFYTPQNFTHPMRCYCSLLRGLPQDQTASLTYCQCSRGFVEKNWEAVLGHPVQVDLIESCISGASECKFAIHL